MFGESESESPRVPSPWDSLISISPTPTPSSLRESTPPPSTNTNCITTTTTPTYPTIPKLVPEAEEGNVEYKLQLLSPSPSRFARLVTQMKWRLLEGGGQAYYELGVADSGCLVGLPRAALEESLETLEMMAGEIGASVIVVKEVEIPAGMHMAGLAGTGSETDIDRWNVKRRMKRLHDQQWNEDGATTTETEAEASTEPDLSSSSTDVDVDADDETDHDRDQENESTHGTIRPIPFHLRFSSKSTLGSNTKTTSLVKFPTESELFELESEDADADVDDSVPQHSHPHRFSIDLEIASVFKPRPIRTRAAPPFVPVPQKVKRERGGGKKERFLHLPHRDTVPALVPVVDNKHTQAQHQQPKSLNRRQARDRRRDEKRKALMAYAVPVSVSQATRDVDDNKDGPERRESQIEIADAVRNTSLPDPLVDDLSTLHLSPSESDPPPNALEQDPSLSLSSSLDDNDNDNDNDLDVFASPTQITGFGFPTFPNSTTNSTTSHLPDVHVCLSDTLSTCATSTTNSDIATSTISPNPRGADTGTRLIVEALVVRKMSLEEGFLDFGGFSWM